MPEKPSTIQDRFANFGIGMFGEKHGWKGKYAEALGVSPAQVSSMIKGIVPIGAKMQDRLRDLGADVDYIMTGRKKAQEREVVTQFEMPGHLTKEDGEKYKKLQAEMKKIAEDDPEAIEKMLILVQTVFKKKS